MKRIIKNPLLQATSVFQDSHMRRLKLLTRSLWIYHGITATPYLFFRLLSLCLSWPPLAGRWIGSRTDLGPSVNLCQSTTGDQSRGRGPVPSTIWFSHKRKRIQTSLFFTMSVSALINKNCKDGGVKKEVLKCVVSVQMFCTISYIIPFYECIVKRWGQRERAGQVVWWCVDVPENGIFLTHRAAARVDESLSCSLAACLTLIIKWCSSQSPDLVHAGLSNFLLSTKLAAEIPSYPPVSPSPPSCPMNPCVYRYYMCYIFFNFQFWSVPSDRPCIHPAVDPVLMSLPRLPSSSYISFQPVSTSNLNNARIFCETWERQNKWQKADVSCASAIYHADIVAVYTQTHSYK